MSMLLELVVVAAVGAVGVSGMDFDGPRIHFKLKLKVLFGKYNCIIVIQNI